MDALPFIILLVLGVPVVLAIWLIVRAVRAKNRIAELMQRTDDLQSQILRLSRLVAPAVTKPAEPAKTFVPATPPPRETAEEIIPPAETIATQAPPPIIPPLASQPLPKLEPAPEPVRKSTPAPTPPPLAPLRPSVSKINWEQFMGVKGFAWLGGFALFLGIAFFIKYSFDNNLVPPELRVAIGFLAGLGLLVGGVVLSRKNFAALSQTLCATGVVVPLDPRLLDLVRNDDEDEDRSDLTLAQG